MKILFTFFLLTLSLSLMATPMSLAESHIGKTILNNYLHAPLATILKEIELIHENKKQSIGKSILLNLYGHNFDTTLTHDGKKVISLTRVFYDEESAPDFHQEIKKVGKKFFKLVKIESGPKPGTFYDYNFKDQGLFFRFNHHGKIQVITIKK